MSETKQKSLFNHQRERFQLKWAEFSSIVAVAFCCFQLYTAGVGPFPNLIQNSIFIGFTLVLGLGLYTGTKKENLAKYFKAMNILLILLTVIPVIYVIINYDWIMEHPAESTNVEILLAIILVAIVLEMARRTIGLFFPCFALLSILYAYFGNLVPGFWGHRGFGFSFIFENLFHGTSGIFGLLVWIGATLIAIFIIFGNFLLHTGAGETFIDLSSIIAGRSTGGAAKIAVIASAFFGMISGSAVANVATTGNFTIPMMKRLKYSPALAGAVEATASTGGQITPPILGAAAFLMAEILGINYLYIVVASIFPALLFYIGVFSAIHFTAKKVGLPVVPKEEMPSLRKVLTIRRSSIITVPIIVLFYFLLKGYTANTAAFWATITLILLYIGISKWTREGILIKIKALIRALESAGKGLVVVGSLLICAQILISMINLTGIGIKMSETIISLSGGTLWIALILAAIVAMILGMGIPSTAAYILVASVLAPALISLQVEILSAHLFLFYYAIVSVITPPVCAAVFVACGISGADWWETAKITVKLAAVKYVIPFLFIFHPELLFKGNIFNIGITVLFATLFCISVSALTSNYFLYKTNLTDKLLLFLIIVLSVTIKLNFLIPILAIGSLFLLIYKQKREIRKVALVNE